MNFFLLHYLSRDLGVLSAQYHMVHTTAEAATSIISIKSIDALCLYLGGQADNSIHMLPIGIVLPQSQFSRHIFLELCPTRLSGMI